MKYLSKNEKETRKLATDFSKQLRGGEVILMYGDLGAGKTVFVKGLAKALGVREVVKSPTFNLMKCYKIMKAKNQKIKKAKENPPQPPFAKGGKRTVLCHIDAYRLKNFDDLLDIGADEYLGKENVISVVEWAERVKEKLRITNYRRAAGSRSRDGLRIIRVKIQHGKKNNERILDIRY